MNIPLALLITLLIAVACGLFNGFMIGYCKINSMLVTLGTQSLFTGIGLVISKGQTVPIPTDRFGLFGRTKLFGFLPVDILVIIFGFALAVLIFSYLIPGRRIYLIGANTEVARFAGINISLNIMLTYVICAVYAFLGAIVLASRVASGRADVASALVLKSVSAAVFGGVSTLGGIGTMAGAMLGVLVIQIITNGMDMMNLSTYIQQISIGVVLLVVLAFRHRKSR
jgi:ribose/xylose/arabinose/galactoside ABC-type transport system permease subunit